MSDAERDEKLKKLWSDYGSIEDQGHKLQREGLKIAKAGADGRRFVKSLEDEHPRCASIQADLDTNRVYDWADLGIRQGEPVEE